jgi:hypothetical protein
MQKLFRNILVGILVVTCAAYCIYTITRYFYSPYRTETVYAYTVADSCTVKAVAVRTEQRIEAAPAGVLSYLYPDATMVKQGAAIAQVYPNEEDLHWRNLAAQYAREIEILESAQGASGLFWGTSTLSPQINDSIGNLVDSVKKNDLSGLGENRQQLQLLLGRKLASTGQAADFSQRVAFLREKITDADSRITKTPSEIYSPGYGYFCSVADGFEDSLSAADIENLTAQTVQDVIDGRLSPAPDESAVGRIVTDHNWYLAFLVSNQDAQRLSPGLSLMLDFGQSDANDLPATVTRVVPDGAAGQALVILKCNRVNAHLIALRISSVQIRFRSISGLKISTSALRFEGQTEGVYVLEANQVVFKPIEKLYESNMGFTLCTGVQDEESPLRQFDEVITEGVDLYDGKAVD